MRVLQLGNFGAPHSTENHLRRALEAGGHEVIAVQESPVAFQAVPRQASRHKPAFVLWTHTHGLAPEATHGRQAAMLDGLRSLGVPSVAYHLDRWWGLDREDQVWEEPFFRCDLVCTADGGHAAEWETAEVNHRWFPPGVLAAACEPRGRYRYAYGAELAFVGSWQGGYHDEWQHRSELVRFLRDEYGDRCAFWPKPGQHAIRGAELNDLYASVDILVGDSCLVPNRDGSPCSNYCSDRIPETLGRGAFLLHPFVPGIVWGDGLWSSGDHLAGWTLGDFDELADKIDNWLRRPVERERVAQAGRALTLREHSYERRMVQLVELMTAEGLL